MNVRRNVDRVFRATYEVFYLFLRGEGSPSRFMKRFRFTGTDCWYPTGGLLLLRTKGSLALEIVGGFRQTGLASSVFDAI